MLNKLLYSAILMSAAAAAHADAPVLSYTFSYTGFIYDPANGPPEWDPNATLKGSFSGRDLNGDGILRPRELSSFILENRQYTRCTATTTMLRGCSLKHFSFAPDGGLEFKLSWYEVSNPEPLLFNHRRKR